MGAGAVGVRGWVVVSCSRDAPTGASAVFRAVFYTAVSAPPASLQLPSFSTSRARAPRASPRCPHAPPSRRSPALSGDARSRPRRSRFRGVHRRRERASGRPPRGGCVSGVPHTLLITRSSSPAQPNPRQAASAARGARRDSGSEEEVAALPAAVAAAAEAAAAAPTPPAAPPAATLRVPAARAQLLRPAACFGLLACVGLACVTAQVGAAAALWLRYPCARLRFACARLAGRNAMCRRR